MLKFPKIYQFSHFVKRARERAQFKGVDADGAPVFDRAAPLPTVTVSGSTKLHGTNGAIVLQADGNLAAQSRNRVLTVDDDNMGFAAYVAEHGGMHMQQVCFSPRDSVTALYGEWVGQGVQRGVAVSELPRRFVPFAVFGDVSGWRRPAEVVEAVRERWTLEVDLARPDIAQARMVELVAEVEARCPYAFRHGIEGIGEGIVWWCDTPGFQGPDFWFKTKGEKHSRTRVRKLSPVDAERMSQVRAFAAAAVTDRRVEQGFEYLREMGLPEDRTSTGAYLKWLVGDILVEEADALEEVGLTKRDVGKALSVEARTQFFRQLDAGVGP